MKSKLFSLIVSVLAAMCLWVYVMTVVNPDVDLVIGNIPVTFSGAEVLQEDHGLVITGDYQEFVSVHFYGKNADLKTLDQHKDEIKAVVDVSKVRSTKEYTMTYDITLPQRRLRLLHHPGGQDPHQHHLHRRAADPQVGRGQGRFLQRPHRRGLHARQHELRL